MSNIYIQEPPTNGKVLLKTTVGDIDIELWSKETPKAARNFVQLCLEGYYDGTAFHRVVKEFIVQGGDPTDTGDGGESVYGSPFKDEFHQRLRFVRRGLVAMANAGQHDNGSQFFFTMAATPELQNKHTIFGKVVGDTLFNMLKLQEVEVNEVTEKPVEPHRILSTEVLNNPFDDIVPRQIKRIKKDKEDEKKIKSKSKATKNFSLLSFGDEAEDDEEQVDKATESFRGKSKSSHDLTDDPRLSSIPAVEKDLNMEEEKRKKKLEGTPEDKTKKSPDTEDKETKTEVAEDEAKKKTEPAEDAKKGKTEAKEDEKKKKQPDTPERPEKKKKQPDTPERPEKKKSPAVAEEDSPKKKTEGEEEARKAVTKEEPKEESKKKKAEPETTPPESRKRKAEDGGHKEERQKKRSKEREDEERKKRKADSKEEEGRKKRKGEEERKKTEEEKGEAKKKVKTEPAETSTQPTPEEKVVKEEGEARKVKKEKEDATSRGKEQEGRSLLGSSEESKQQRMEELKKEQRKLQRDIKDFKKRAHDKVKVKTEEPEEEVEEKVEEEVEDNDLLAMVKKERQKYKLKKKELGHRENREADTLAMLAKFQTKLSNAHTLAGDYDDMDDEEKNAEGDEDDPTDMSWMRHKLHFEEQAAKSRVIDANVHDDDRYSINDPRNPLTQRRRETSKKSMRDKR